MHLGLLSSRHHVPLVISVGAFLMLDPAACGRVLLVPLEDINKTETPGLRLDIFQHGL